MFNTLQQVPLWCADTTQASLTATTPTFARDLLIYARLFIRSVHSTFLTPFARGLATMWRTCLFIQFMLFSDVLSCQIAVYLSDSPPHGGLLILCWQAWSSVHNFYFRHEARVLYVIYDILIIRSDRSSFSLTLHRVGACSSYVDKHDLQCIIFISDPSFAYPCYYPCCRRCCFLLTGCSAIGVIGLSTSTHLSSYMKHLSHTRPPYLCQGLICTQLFSRYSSLWLPPSCVHSHQKHYRHVIYMMLAMDFITYFLYLLERTVSFNPLSGVPKGFSRYTA